MAPSTPHGNQEFPRVDSNASEVMRHVRFLAEKIGPRAAGSEAEARAARYIARVLRKNGYDVRLQGSIPVRGRSGRTANVVARSPRHSGERVIVVGAHYDSMVGREASPGANDNASGVAVLLETARLLRDVALDYELIFVFFGGEEVHHEGSRWFVASSRCLPKHGAAMIEVDMIGVGETLRLNYAAGTNDIGARVREATKTIGVPVQEEGDNPHSDHEAFARTGVPAVWIQRLPDDRNHSAGDTAKRVRPEAVQRVVDVLCTCLLQMAREVGERQ